MDPFDSFNPPSGTDAGPLNIIFKGVKKLGHTPARAGQPAHARGNHPSTMEREDMHARADQPAHARGDHPSTMKREDMHARADQPAHAHADHPSTMKREDMHACADQPAQCQPAPLIVLSQAHCKNAVEKAYSFVGRGSDVGVQT